MSRANRDSEKETSISDSQNQKKLPVGILFDEIIKFSEEYTTATVKELLTHKTELYQILQTHRPIKIVDYQYGMSESSKENARLIVNEWDNKEMCRDYSKLSQRKNLWECIKCHRLISKKERSTRIFLRFVDGIVFVPIEHTCPPKDYNLVIQYQEFLNDGNLKGARSMTQKCDFDFKGDLPSQFVINPAHEAAFTLKRKLNNDSPADKKPFVYKKLKRERPKSEGGKEPVKELDASITELKQICNKLDIEYCKDAEKTWTDMEFKEINTVSKNIVTQKFKAKNFYKLLSNFFIGKDSEYARIYFAINSAFRDVLVADGEMPCEEINLLCCTSYAVTEKHFNFIPKFIPCRLLIFDRDNDEVRKYGDWESSDNIMALVLSYSHKKYSIVSNM